LISSAGKHEEAGEEEEEQEEEHERRSGAKQTRENEREGKERKAKFVTRITFSSLSRKLAHI